MRYIKDRKLAFIFYITFILIFSIIFYLYNIHKEPLIYGIILCTTIAFIFVFVDSILYYKKHRELKAMEKNIDIVIDELPRPITLIEEDYNNLLKELNVKYRNTISNYDLSKKEMIDYYAMWAHQIKTPISAMSLLLQLQGDIKKKDLKNELFKVEQYVDMVLNYLRADSSASDLLLQRYNLSTIVKGSVKKYANIFISKNIALELGSLDEEVVTDEKWLSFVIEQLISNSLKYTTEGKIKIYMDKDKEATLVIEDTGIGIASDDLPRIFEKGFTGYNGRMDKKASGIGLYLCKRILDKLSHKIYIESEVGKGTKVYLKVKSKK